ncbi:MAG TPA: UbiA family prenyltransferase [Dehalococcoidia bacterium]|nr:UbiA family prenyltransferase [Dehalococcoidia bacterium]
MTIVGEESEPVWSQHEAGARPVPPGLSFWRLYFVEMRPYLMFLSAMTGVAGMAFAPGVSLPDLLALTALFFLAYGFGQALTDCFQTDTDALSAPYRPLAQGRLRQRDVLLVSLAGLVAGGVVLAAYSPPNLALVAGGVAGLVTYTWFKRRWWGGPLYNGWIVVDLCLIGYVSGLGAIGGTFNWTPELIATLFAVLFGYANFVLAGYFKDISADRASGYNTLPVVFGLRVSAIVSDALAALALLSSGLALVLINDLDADAGLLLSAMLITGAAGWTALGQLRLHKVTSESQAHRAIAPVVHAYILALCAIAAALQPEWVALLIPLYAGFAVALAHRPMKEQI